MKKIFLIIFLSFILIGCESAKESQPITSSTDIQSQTQVQEQTDDVETNEDITKEYFLVTRVIDGDTIDVDINGQIQRIRLIGIDTPETVDPRKEVECFGQEASDKLKGLLANKKISLEADESQGDVDKYDRLLRFVFTEDNENIGYKMIGEGYAYEYTYSAPYKYQELYKGAQKSAQDSRLGIWAEDVCNKVETAQMPELTPAPEPDSTPVVEPVEDTRDCDIKGNISSKDNEKIYHVQGCASYGVTKIDTSKGERWFCTEAEALEAGWRKALNCPK